MQVLHIYTDTEYTMQLSLLLTMGQDKRSEDAWYSNMHTTVHQYISCAAEIILYKPEPSVSQQTIIYSKLGGGGGRCLDLKQLWTHKMYKCL